MEEEQVKDIRKQVDEQIENIQNENLERGNVDYLYRLVDIKKDFLEIECKEKELNNMYDRRYRDYDEGRYGARGRDSRGRYSGRDEDAMEDMYRNYRTYRDDMNRYGHGDEKALEKMLESGVDFFEYLKEEYPEHMEMIEHYVKKMGR